MDPSRDPSFPMTASVDSDDPQCVALATQMSGRIRCEVELLASIAASPRAARSVLREGGITLDSFTADDTRALYRVLHQAGEPIGPPWNLEKMVALAIDLLDAVGMYDLNDPRGFASGCRWGTAALIRLFTCCDFDQPTVQHCIGALTQRANYGNL